MTNPKTAVDAILDLAIIDQIDSGEIDRKLKEKYAKI